MNAPDVAQTVSLLFRRLAVGSAPHLRTPADCQSATQQIANLRYGQTANDANGARPSGRFNVNCIGTLELFPSPRLVEAEAALTPRSAGAPVFRVVRSFKK